MEMYEENKVKVKVDDVFVEGEIPEHEEHHEGFGAKVKRGLRNFVNDPVSGGKKVGLLVGALVLGGLMERHHSRKDRELLEEEITQTVLDKDLKPTGEVVKMKKRDVIAGIDKTHYVDIRPITKVQSYREFKKKN